MLAPVGPHRAPARSSLATCCGLGSAVCPRITGETGAARCGVQRLAPHLAEGIRVGLQPRRTRGHDLATRLSAAFQGGWSAREVGCLHPDAPARPPPI